MRTGVNGFLGVIYNWLLIRQFSPNLNPGGRPTAFRDLNNRQARIFALMANLHSLPAGTRLITEGDASGSIYVVIDGELAVFKGSANKRTEINRMQRGDVVGEIGYFGQRRSASVDTLTETRLLRFDDEDQERLCVAYPAIASRVFLNLNRIQAQRQSRNNAADAGAAVADEPAKQAADEDPESFDSKVH